MKSELTNNGTFRQILYPPYMTLVRFVAPIFIVLIFLNELGLFSWFL
ncbi:MAG: hypothetical protein HUJ99_00080 [Bacteroidaceae bacterium]|nr:hypothetical protein [Bacteroidaceae bacterium]